MRVSQIALFVCALPALAFAQSAPAIDAKAAQDLTEKHYCTACHQIDMKVVGPSLKEVAAKYRGSTKEAQAEAQAKLVDKVKKGGAGAWGSIPMPANPTVKDEDVQLMVAWILSL